VQDAAHGLWGAYASAGASEAHVYVHDELVACGIYYAVNLFLKSDVSAVSEGADQVMNTSVMDSSRRLLRRLRISQYLSRTSVPFT